MSKKPRWFIQLAITLVLVAIGAAGLVVLTLSKPPMAQHKAPVVRPLVRTMEVKIGSLAISVTGEGTVQPLRQSTLATQIRGQVIEVSPSLVSGGAFRKGQVLVKIDPRDYELAVTLARAKVLEALTGMQKAQEEAAVSLEEWKRFAKKKDSAPPPLVAKEPQLAEAKAKLEAGRAQLARAELDLSRCSVKTPYDGRVSAKYVDLGQYLKAGERVAGVYATQAAEITVPLEDGDLAWIKVPGFTTGPGQGSAAVVSARLAGRQRTWPGRVLRAEGRLDEKSRMVPVVVRVENPYAQTPPLAVGLYVTVNIEGEKVSGAVRLPRAALRPGQTVWVVDDESILHFVPVHVARRQGSTVLITSGLKSGEKVVISPLKGVSNGMAVRLSDDEENGS